MTTRWIITYAPGSGGVGSDYDPIGDPDRLPDPRAAGIAASRICRYGGHLLTSARRPWLLLGPGDPADNRLGDGIYSVAQHSTILSYLVRPELALEAHIHDLTEGLGLFDLQSPLKRAMPGYKTVEASVARPIYAAHGIDRPSPEVKGWDRNIIWTERRDLHGASLRPWDAPEGSLLLPLRIRPLRPLQAARAWLRRYAELTGQAPMREPSRAWNQARYALGLRTLYTGAELVGLRLPGDPAPFLELARAWRFPQEKED